MLRDMLARFHAAITGRAPLDSARELVVRGDVDELARLGVYAHAYTARLAGVLVQDYPKLARLVALEALAPAYLHAYPPAHPSVREVGAHLARYLAGHGHAAVLADLAQLERARTEVFDGPDATPLARDDLAALDPVDFAALRLQLVPASRVVVMTSNADAIWDALEHDDEPPSAVSAERVVLVWRRDYTVIHRTLEPDEARVATGLARGMTFADTCELLGESAERALVLLLRWLDAQCLRRARLAL